MEPKSLDDVERYLTGLLGGYEEFWAVAGGWAIDFFIGEETRAHKDIEIVAWRDQQASLQDFLSDWDFVYRQNKQSFGWIQGQILSLPIHEIHANHRKHGQLEILLNEREDGQWVFRRNSSVRIEEEKFSMRSKSGIRYLSPEIVLLYKSGELRSRDWDDLLICRDCLDIDAREWLRHSLEATDKVHPWLPLV